MQLIDFIQRAVFPTEEQIRERAEQLGVVLIHQAGYSTENLLPIEEIDRFNGLLPLDVKAARSLELSAKEVWATTPQTQSPRNIAEAFPQLDLTDNFTLATALLAAHSCGIEIFPSNKS